MTFMDLQKGSPLKKKLITALAWVTSDERTIYMQCSKQEILQTIASGDFMVIDVEEEYKKVLENAYTTLGQHDSNPNKLVLGCPGKGMAFHPGDYDDCQSVEEIKVRFFLLRKKLPDEDDIQTISEFYHIDLDN